MINHPPHVENARKALRFFDMAPTGAEAGRRGVMVATALRCLLFEPADEYQGDFTTGRIDPSVEENLRRELAAMTFGPAPTAPHGTVSAYKRHLRHRDQPCEACRKAWAEYHRKRYGTTAQV